MSYLAHARSRVTAGRALRAAALCALGLALTWVVAELVPVTHVRDAIALHDFTELNRPRTDWLAGALVGMLDPPLYALWAGALVAVALARRRVEIAIAVAVVTVLAPLSADLLKPLLAHTHATYGVSEIRAASWPSGHSTAAMSLALGGVLVAPRQLRPAVAALGTLFTVAVGFSLLMLAWHMPSDVFGGYLLAALWSALAVAALCRLEQRPLGRREPPPAGRGVHAAGRILNALLAAAVATIAAGLAAVALDAPRSGTFALEHLSLLVAAAGITLLAALIAWTLTLALRR